MNSGLIKYSTERLGNGTRTSFNYDVANQQTQISHVTSSSTVLLGLNYAYDPAGKRKGMTESGGSRLT